MKTHLQVASLLVLALALAGCRAGYQVDVRNQTDQPIVAQLVSPHEDGLPRVLREGRLGPGDRVQLLVQTDAKQRIGLRADFAGNTGYPAVMDISSGTTVVNVRRTDTGSKGQIRLEEVPRP